MPGKLAKVTTRGQTTVPKSVREALRISPGDVLRFEVEGDRAILSKVSSDDAAYLMGVEATLEEWLSDADEEAYRDL